MSDEYGPTFITITDDEGAEHVLEYVDTQEYQGQTYMAFFPAEPEDSDQEPDTGLVILKVVRENGEELLSTLDSDEELDAVYDVFVDALFDDEEEPKS
jgi:uncharacterized protein YrzB (UPF0473 family)